MANPTGNQNKPDPKQTPQKPKFSRGILSWMLIVFVLIMLWGAINGTGSGKELTSWNDFITRAKAHQFEGDKVTIENTRILAVIGESDKTPVGSIDIPAGTEVYFPIASGADDWYKDELKEAGIDFSNKKDTRTTASSAPRWIHSH